MAAIERAGLSQDSPPSRFTFTFVCCARARLTQWNGYRFVKMAPSLQGCAAACGRGGILPSPHKGRDSVTAGSGRVVQSIRAQPCRPTPGMAGARHRRRPGRRGGAAWLPPPPQPNRLVKHTILSGDLLLSGLGEDSRIAEKGLLRAVCATSPSMQEDGEASPRTNPPGEAGRWRCTRLPAQLWNWLALLCSCTMTEGGVFLNHSSVSMACEKGRPLQSAACRLAGHEAIVETLGVQSRV